MQHGQFTSNVSWEFFAIAPFYAFSGPPSHRQRYAYRATANFVLKLGGTQPMRQSTIGSDGPRPA
jgi:hypothetical protein